MLYNIWIRWCGDSHNVKCKTTRWLFEQILIGLSLRLTAFSQTARRPPNSCSRWPASEPIIPGTFRPLHTCTCTVHVKYLERSIHAPAICRPTVHKFYGEDSVSKRFGKNDPWSEYERTSFESSVQRNLDVARFSGINNGVDLQCMPLQPFALSFRIINWCQPSVQYYRRQRLTRPSWLYLQPRHGNMDGARDTWYMYTVLAVKCLQCHVVYCQSTAIALKNTNLHVQLYIKVIKK